MATLEIPVETPDADSYADVAEDGERAFCDVDGAARWQWRSTQQSPNAQTYELVNELVALDENGHAESVIANIFATYMFGEWAMAGVARWNAGTSLRAQLASDENSKRDWPSWRLARIATEAMLDMRVAEGNFVLVDSGKDCDDVSS